MDEGLNNIAYIIVKKPSGADTLLVRPEQIEVVRKRRCPCHVRAVAQPPGTSLWYRHNTDRFEALVRNEEGRWCWGTDRAAARVWRCQGCRVHVVVDCACRYVMDERYAMVYRTLSDEEMRCEALRMEDPAFRCAQCTHKGGWGDCVYPGCDRK